MTRPFLRSILQVLAFGHHRTRKGERIQVTITFRTSETETGRPRLCKFAESLEVGVLAKFDACELQADQAGLGRPSLARSLSGTLLRLRLTVC